MTASSAIGVAIVTFNSADVIIGCLESLFASQGAAPRVVVTDNASRDDTVATIRDWAAGRAAANPGFRFAEGSAGGEAAPSAALTLLHAGFNGGYAHGVNAGLRLLLSDDALDLFWVLNPDCEVAPDAAAQYLAHGADGCFALMGGRTIYREAPCLIQTDGGQVSPWTGICRSLNAGRAPAEAAMPAAAEIDYVTGANLVASRAFIEQAGLMTEDYFLYYEEVDWAFRRGSLPLRLAPDAIVYHHGGTSIGSRTASQRASAFAWYFNTRNRIRFLRRHRPLAVPFGVAHALAKAAQLLLTGERVEARAVLTGAFGLPPPAQVRARIAPGQAQVLAFGSSR